VSTILSNNTSYYWRIQQKNGVGVWGDRSATWSFTVNMDKPINHSPIGISYLYSSPGNYPAPFNWDDVTGAVNYYIQVNESADFTGVVKIDDNTLTTSNFNNASILFTCNSSKTYYWRVKQKNSDGVWGAWSVTWSFILTTD
jgi:hypothetical protein